MGKLVAWGVKWAGKVRPSQSGSGLAMGRASTRIDLWGTASGTISPSLLQHTCEAARRFGGLFGGGGGAFTRSVQTTRGKSGGKESCQNEGAGSTRGVCRCHGFWAFRGRGTLEHPRN